jgi:hypothetical protein
LGVISVSHPVPFGMTLYGPVIVAAVGSEGGIFSAARKTGNSWLNRCYCLMEKTLGGIAYQDKPLLLGQFWQNCLD